MKATDSYTLGFHGSDCGYDAVKFVGYRQVFQRNPLLPLPVDKSFIC